MCLVILRAIRLWATGNAFPESDFSGTNTWANSETPHGISLFFIVGCVKALAVRTVLRPSDVGKGVNTVAVHTQGLSVRRGCLSRVAQGYASGAGAKRRQ